MHIICCRLCWFYSFLLLSYLLTVSESVWSRNVTGAWDDNVRFAWSGRRRFACQYRVSGLHALIAPDSMVLACSQACWIFSHWLDFLSSFFYVSLLSFLAACYSQLLFVLLLSLWLLIATNVVFTCITIYYYYYCILIIVLIIIHVIITNNNIIIILLRGVICCLFCLLVFIPSWFQERN